MGRFLARLLAPAGELVWLDLAVDGRVVAASASTITPVSGIGWSGAVSADGTKPRKRRSGGSWPRA